MASVARQCAGRHYATPSWLNHLGTLASTPPTLLPALSCEFWNTLYNIPVIEGQKVRGKSMIYFDWVKMSWPGHDAHASDIVPKRQSSCYQCYLVLKLTSQESTTKVLPQSAVQSVCKFLRFLQSPPSEWRDAAWNILNWSRCEQFTIYAKYFCIHLR